MRYTVTWTETALQQLAQIWIESLYRETINAEVEQIDWELTTDPDLKGDDYFGDRYILLSNLWVLFTITSEDMIVKVLQVGRIGFELPHDNLPPPV